ncbi:isoeugenol synthase 1-like [Prunus dulcis]|uniref:isoeugenol synthase 1-like n=1 Tax=Prunus dulcis TaxID=3755 RepID=UPI001483139C|nr:isoeugenol synthase 1-like [Prunus dulcis]
MMACEKSKILIIGATGYLGKYMLKASVSLGHPTYAYVRPIKPKTDSSKLLLHKEFEAMGATIFQGELDDHEKLVKAVEQVDVVISTVAVPQHLEQQKLIKAIKDAGNIKRFIPSEFGNEVDRISGLPPFEALLDNKRKIRRAIEAAGIPYTYVSANSFGAYFVDYLLHPREKTNHQVTVYGTGEAKALLSPDNVAVSILHNIFIKGDQMSFELTENDLEASELYPDYKCTSIDSFLDICLVDPPKPKLAAFE